MESRRRPAVLISFAVHGVVSACLLLAGIHGGLQERARIVKPASRCFVAMVLTAGGSHALALPADEMPSTGQSRKSTEISDAARRADPNRAPHRAKSAPPPNPASTGTGTGPAAAGGGTDAEDATPAFPLVSPKPTVKDRSLLPSAEQQIVVDVDVNAQGEVVSETLVKGMGTALDQIVLETVKGWRFHPATVNGTAVASESELIFPFNLSYPVTRG